MTGMARTGVVEGTRPALFSEATSPCPRPRSLSFNVYMASKHIEIATEAVEDTTDDDFIPYEIPDRLQDDCLVKYFRIRFHDQEYFLSKLNNPTKKDAQKMKMTIEKMKIEAHRIAKEIDRIEKLRLSFASTPENALRMWHYESCRSQWKNHAIDSREENIRTLKERIQEMELEEQESIRRQNWERRILDKVRKWNKAPITQRPNDPEGAKKAQEKKDIEEKKARERKEASAKARLDRLLFTLRGGKGNEEEAKPKPKKNKGRVDPQKDPRPRPDDSYGLTITKITLRRSDPACNSSFMSYKMKKYPLNDCLFKEEDNPLTEACEPNTIRYFHIPANNMHWIEEAIGRYYDEKTPGEYNYRQDPNYLRRSSDLLCREFWTSLQHGGSYDPVHARHMRAHCSRISPETTCANGGNTSNFIVFMPYLHWESHKRRKKIAEETMKITQMHQETQSHDTENLKAEFIKLSEQIKIKHARALTGFGTTEEREKQKEKEKLAKTLTRGPLGNYLMRIAKLYDAMDVEPDVRLLRDHLFQNPPLHSRRTLDQSYYWKLPNTDGRDQDQVVYRETKEGKNISRTTRVVMVDQLWMYILDDNTIITSFPRRWGRNKPDLSGVHKGIRARLDHLRVGQVQSVYDLGLVILNQCSTVFFDLTKPVDERPEVLDIFSNALSHVSGMTTVAYATFWQHLDKLNAIDRHLDFEATARTYLNINPEGELLKEAHDIIEELRMMSRIYTQQLNVLEDFSRHLENIHQQDEKKSPIELRDIMLDIKNLLGTINSPHSAEDPLAGQHNHSPTQSGSVVPYRALNRSSTANNSSLISQSTVEFAKRVCNNIILRRQALLELEENSVSVSDQLNHLLSLKQQQASIIEAKLALKRADESVIQGRSIMLFTIVTIIFLPLSFMTSVFGMNSTEFQTPGGGNSMSIKHQFKLIFPISVGVIIVSISLAFSPWIRSIIGFVTHITFASIAEYTYIRHIWLWLITKPSGKGEKERYSPDGMYLRKQEIVKKIYDRKDRKAAREWMHRAGFAERRAEKKDLDDSADEGGGKRGRNGDMV